MCDDYEVPTLRGLLRHWQDSALDKLRSFWWHRVLRQPEPQSPYNLTISKITSEALKVLETQLTFAEASESLKNFESKIGSLNVRRPIRFMETEK